MRLLALVIVLAIVVVYRLPPSEQVRSAVWLGMFAVLGAIDFLNRKLK